MLAEQKVYNASCIILAPWIGIPQGLLISDSKSKIVAGPQWRAPDLSCRTSTASTRSQSERMSE